MRVLTENFPKQLDLLSEQPIRRIDIATAWATEGDGLDALEGLVDKHEVAIRTLVGISGRHTTPQALARLSEVGEVRLVDDSPRLFHVKLYLFQMQHRSLAWVGSANFTRNGFAGNEELLLETKSTDDLQAWFDDRWKSVAKDARARLRKYCDEWSPPSPMIGVDSPLPQRSRKAAAAATKISGRIVFEQEGRRPPPLGRGDRIHKRPAGYVTVAGKRFRYQNSQRAVIAVLEELQRRDSTFLERCLEHEGFHREGRRNYFIARTRTSLGTPHFQKYAEQMESGWWISKQTQTQEKWEIVKAAAEVAELELAQPRRFWRAEARPRTKVGF